MEDESKFQIVPFSYSSPFQDALQVNERLFDLGGCLVKIRQAWKPDGKGGSDIGFGASVYAAAFVFADLITTTDHKRCRGDWVKGRAVVALGVGLGLEALACVKAGAASVVATDGDAALLRESTRPNIDHNRDAIGLVEAEAGGCTAQWRHEASAATLSLSPLLWGDEAQLAALPGGPCDVVVAAEVAAAPYAAAFPQLVETIRRLVERRATRAEAAASPPDDGGSRPNPALVVVYRPRHAIEAKFFHLLRAAGFCELERVPQADLHPDFNGTDGAGGHVQVISYTYRPPHD